MSIISAADIAALSAIDEAAMPDTATIRRYTSVTDCSGGTTDTYADVATTKCRINLYGMQANDSQIGGELLNTLRYMIHTPSGVDVRNKDQIVIGARTFEVDKALAHTYQTSLRITATELT